MKIDAFFFLFTRASGKRPQPATVGAARCGAFFVFEQIGKFSEKETLEIDRRAETMGLLNWILNLIYPPRCAVCHALLQPGSRALCPACERSLPRTFGGGLRTGTAFSVCVSPLFYRDAVREAVIALKFHGKTSGVPLFGQWMADCIREHLADNFDVITWVPVSRRRLRSRGYDQAKLLAAVVSKQLEVPLVSALGKRADNPAQSGINDPQQRAENVRGVYAARKEVCAGKRILLIDDVITTGSTMESAALALRSVGAVSVVCCTLASTAVLEQEDVPVV